MSEHDTAVSGRTASNQQSAVPPVDTNRYLRWGAYLLLAAGAAYVVHGIGFLYRTFYTSGFELGVNELDGLTAPELAGTHPDVASYIAHLHVSFAGLMIATGIGIVAITWFGVRQGQRWAWATAVGMPLVFGAFSIPVHSTVHFHFDFLLHLGPAGVGLLILLVGGVLSYVGLRSIEETPTEDDQ